MQLLFTVGMTLIDSLDSIIMLYSYAGFPERSFAIFELRHYPDRGSPRVSESSPYDPSRVPFESGGLDAIGSAVVDLEDCLEPAPDPVKKPTGNARDEGAVVIVAGEDDAPEYRRTMHTKRSAMSNLSIILTTMSIVVAFR